MHKFLTASILGLVTMGCTAETETGNAEAPNVRHTLSEERAFDIDTQTSEVAIVADGSWLDDESIVELPILSGSAVVVAEGDELVVSALDLAFEDIEIDGDGGMLIESGDRLSDLTVQLRRAAPAETTWDDRGAQGEGTYDLTVGWSLRIKGHELDLSDQTISGLPFSVAVVDDERGLRLEVDTSAEGQLWSMAPALEVQRIEISLDGVAAL